VLNVLNLIEWSFNLLIPAQSAQFGTFVNPQMATLTRGSSKVEKKTWQSTSDSKQSFHQNTLEYSGPVPTVVGVISTIINGI